jgi:PH and SEC7 domain-containing protein
VPAFDPLDVFVDYCRCRSRINQVSLRYYIDYFDFSNMRLDHAFRRLCAKLFLKAETQQVDRILVEFSRRYHECNPDNLFGNSSKLLDVLQHLLTF